MDDQGRRSGTQKAVVWRVRIHLQREEGPRGSLTTHVGSPGDFSPQESHEASCLGERRLEEGALSGLAACSTYHHKCECRNLCEYRIL